MQPEHAGSAEVRQQPGVDVQCPTAPAFTHAKVAEIASKADEIDLRRRQCSVDAVIERVGLRIALRQDRNAKARGAATGDTLNFLAMRDHDRDARITQFAAHARVVDVHRAAPAGGDKHAESHAESHAADLAAKLAADGRAVQCASGVGESRNGIALPVSSTATIVICASVTRAQLPSRRSASTST